MKTTIRFVLANLIFLSGLISCNKDFTGKYYPINENIKNWGEFNKGSFWIFLNDSTNELMDTIGIVLDHETKVSPAVSLMEIDPKIDTLYDSFEFRQTEFSSITFGIYNKNINGFIDIYGNDVIQWYEIY